MAVFEVPCKFKNWDIQWPSAIIVKIMIFLEI